MGVTEESVRQSAFRGAAYVFAVQLLMITFVMQVILKSDTFMVCFPKTVFGLGARFVASILMHFNVEPDVRQGIYMMKYVTNHSKDFTNPGFAYAIGLMQMTGGLAAEVLCMLYLTSIRSTIDTIIRFMALASIANVDDWYAGALQGSPLKKKVSLPYTVRKRDIEASDEPRGCAFHMGRFVYKMYRILYCSYMYYFMPFSCIIIPYLATSPGCAAK